jgi:hypothetical protein
VEVTFDPAKNERNIKERGLSFERAADFDFETAVFVEDDRKDYARNGFGPWECLMAACTLWCSRCAARFSE